MIYVAYFIFSFTVIQFLIALVNLLTQTHLPYSSGKCAMKISVLIPARNEQDNIGNLLNDFESLKVNDLEILVFDDQSEDNTAPVINEFVSRDGRFRIIQSDGLPEGWLGKNYACHSLAAQAKGDYLLFLDADVRINASLIPDALHYAEETGSDLVSIFPMQKIITAGEWATVPNMNYILASLLPLLLVRKTKNQSLAAANGQFMLFRSSVYKEALPHELFKNNKVEDILTARFFKKIGYRVSCLLGDERITCRMYSGYSEAVNGFSKNITEFFGGSYSVAVTFWVLTTFGFFPVFWYLPAHLSAAYLFFWVLTRIAIARSGRQSIIKNLVFIIPLQLSMGVMIYKSFINKTLNRYVWKGRMIKH
ncbi:MAG TPA: glycosyltransferase family 2 protein [Bacteroidales bacterium]|nr:glycosyltransferase family 2 protein [Bacteroidales bacterium]